jgi:hypothetical protein
VHGHTANFFTSAYQVYSLADGSSEGGKLQEANGVLRVRTHLLHMSMNKISCVNRSWPAFLWTVMMFGGSGSPTTCPMIPEHQSLVIVNKSRNTCYFQIPKNHAAAISTASTVYNTHIRGITWTIRTVGTKMDDLLFCHYLSARAKDHVPLVFWNVQLRPE